jgi:hypothetical protein
MPLLGYNFSYSKKYNVDDKYKYTSIAFAWGRQDEFSNVYRISDFSIPVIFDRGLVSIEEIKDNDTIVSYYIRLGDYTFLRSEECELNYYRDKCIYCI